MIQNTQVPRVLGFGATAAIGGALVRQLTATSYRLISLRIAIIGAGMAGVSAGRLSADRGHEVTLLGESRGRGGRRGSKRWNGRIVGHGAQYFIMRHPKFSTAVQQARGDALTASRTEDAWLAGCATALNVIPSQWNH